MYMGGDSMRSFINRLIGIVYPYNVNLLFSKNKVYYDTEFYDVCIDFDIPNKETKYDCIVKYVKSKNNGTMVKIYFDMHGKFMYYIDKDNNIVLQNDYERI